MSTIVTRYGKGSPLTWLEVDDNFTNLNNDKYQSGSAATFSSVTDSGLTAGRVTFAGTGGLLSDSASLFWDNSNARLGIGTISPDAKLRVDLNGGGLVSKFVSNTGSTYITVGAASTYQTQFGYNITSEYGFIQPIAAAGVYDDLALCPSGGNVGIGTSSPGAKLHVVGTSLVDLSGTAGTNATIIANTGNTNYLTIKSASANSYGLQISANSTNDVATISNYYSAALVFGTANSERMRIDSSGNVGIGTAAPTSSLHLSSLSSTAAGQYNSPSTITLKNRSGSAGVGGTIVFGADTNLTGAGYGASIYYSNTNSSASGTYGSLVFATKALITDTTVTERMRLDSSGNLGLGVTPAAWDTYTALQIKGGASVLGYSNGSNNNQAIISSNVYYSSSTWKYLISDYATYYRQYSGTHAWFNAPSGTAAATATFTQAMTLDANNNLALGSSTPYNWSSTQAALTLSGLSASYPTRAGVLVFRSQDTTSTVTAINSIDGYMAFYTGTSATTTERMRIDSSGNIGIGTSSPVGLLTANASTASTIGITTYTGNETAERTTISAFAGIGISSYQGVSGSPYTKVSDIVANADGTVPSIMRFWTKTNGQASASERMRIDSSGNVGIGTASPGAILHTVKTSAGAATVGAFLQNSDTTVGTETRLAFASNTNLLSADRYGWIGYINTGGTNGGALTFATTPGGQAATERMRIDSSGNVGIGTTSPVMDGNGSLYVSAISSNGATFNAGASQSGTANFVGGFQFVNTILGGTDKRIATIGGITNGATNSGALVFNTWSAGTGAERMRIDSSGNVLIGTTTSGGLLTVYTSTASDQIKSNSGSAAGTTWTHFNGTSGNNSVQNIKIYGNGNIQNANNSYGALSDLKLKENIIDCSPKLEKLCQVRIVNYNLIGDYEKHKQIGVIAQELEEIFPSMIEETIDKDADGNKLETVTKGVKYSVFVPILIKAIQEQQALINDLTTRLTALEGK